MEKTVRLAVAAVFLALILISCGSGGAGGSADYYVSFTAGGTDYVLSRGYTDDNIFDSGANGAKHSSATEYYITAAGESVAAMNEGPYFALRFEDNTPGTYINTGTEVMVGFSIDGTTDYYDVDDQVFTLNLNSFGSVGEVITGTFSGVIEELDTGTPLTVTNGYFHVERLADGAIAAPSFFN